MQINRYKAAGVWKPEEFVLEQPDAFGGRLRTTSVWPLGAQQGSGGSHPVALTAGVVAVCLAAAAAVALLVRKWRTWPEHMTLSSSQRSSTP